VLRKRDFGCGAPDRRELDPVPKTLKAFDVAASSIQPKAFDYLSSLEWIRAQQNLAIIGPAGTGKSHTLIGLGTAAIQQLRVLAPHAVAGCPGMWVWPRELQL
jgi:DNA replication protein DnaC